MSSEASVQIVDAIIKDFASTDRLSCRNGIGDVWWRDMTEQQRSDVRLGWLNLCERMIQQFHESAAVNDMPKRPGLPVLAEAIVDAIIRVFSLGHPSQCIGGMGFEWWTTSEPMRATIRNVWINKVAAILQPLPPAKMPVAASESAPEETGEPGTVQTPLEEEEAFTEHGDAVADVDQTPLEEPKPAEEAPAKRGPGRPKKLFASE